MMKRVSIVAFGLLLGLMMTVFAGCSKKVKSPEPPEPSGVVTVPPIEVVDKGDETGTIPRPGTRGAEVPADFAQKMVTIHFDFDKSDIRADQAAALEGNAEYLKKHSHLNITIEGHCDERGTLEYNMALGQRRANSVREFLISRGVDGNRLSTVSYGEERPVDPRSNEEAWAKNRRAEFVTP